MLIIFIFILALLFQEGKSESTLMPSALRGAFKQPPFHSLNFLLNWRLEPQASPGLLMDTNVSPRPPTPPHPAH